MYLIKNYYCFAGERDKQTRIPFTTFAASFQQDLYGSACRLSSIILVSGWYNIFCFFPLTISELGFYPSNSFSPVTYPKLARIPPSTNSK